jgi:hypothetical protein
MSSDTQTIAQKLKLENEVRKTKLPIDSFDINPALLSKPNDKPLNKSIMQKTKRFPEINIIYLRKDKNENFIFKVFPSNSEITRSLNDIYNLRSNLVVEFPFYYVCLLDSAC